MGKIAYYKKNYPLALQYFQDILTLGDDSVDEFNFAAHYYRGNIYFRELNFEHSLASCERALRCAETLNSPLKIAQVCITLGSIYAYQGNPSEAFSQFRRAEFISQSHGYSDVEAVVLQNLAMLFASIGDLEQSLTTHHRLIEHYEQVGNQRLLGIECLNTGRSYFMIHNFERAAHFCERAIQLLSSLSGEEENCAAARLTLAEIYLHQHHSDLATSISKKVVSLLEESANKEFLLDAYSILGQSLYQSGDVQGAIAYLKKAVDFSQHKHLKILIAISDTAFRLPRYFAPKKSLRPLSFTLSTHAPFARDNPSNLFCPTFILACQRYTINVATCDVLTISTASITKVP